MAKRISLPAASKGAQLRNKAIWNDSRTKEDAQFFTFGYSGRATNEILNTLKEAGVSTVVDIRFTPISMYKPDFSKKNLQRLIENIDLSYVHVPWLGVPRDIRVRAAEAAELEIIWEWYDKNIVERFLRRNLHWFFNFANHPVALMCVELDPVACHRHRIFQALEDRGLYGFDL